MITSPVYRWKPGLEGKVLRATLLLQVLGLACQKVKSKIVESSQKSGLRGSRRAVKREELIVMVQYGGKG